MTRHLTSITFLLLLGSIACNDDPQQAPTCTPNTDLTSLVDNTLWRQLSAAEDPHADHRPERIDCPDEQLALEGTVLEIDTGKCDYVSVTQALLIDVQPCDTIQAVLTHEALFDVTPATAHVAISMGGQVVFEQEPPIPSPSGLLTPTWQLPQGASAGDPVVFHLHNHGVNTWNLLSLNITPEVSLEDPALSP